MCVRGHVAMYCSAHDEWLIMKLCMYRGYHTANNVSNFGGDPVTQLKKLERLKKCLRCFTGTVHHTHDAATGFAAVLLRDLAQAAGVWKIEAGIKWPYQHKHSHSYIMHHCKCNKLVLLVARPSETGNRFRRAVQKNAKTDERLIYEKGK